MRKVYHDPNFWDDPKNAERILKNIRSKKIWVDAYELVESAIADLDVIFEFHKEGEQLKRSARSE